MEKEKKHLGKKELVAILIAIIIGALLTGLWSRLGYTGNTLKGITILAIVLIFFVIKKYVHAYFDKKEASEETK